MKPITVFGHWGAPNPWKVAMILEELSLPYDWREVEFSDVKGASFLEVNPNGRLPAIQDPNTGITLWESGAIILYLIDQYDKDNKISYNGAPNKYLLQQWLLFQVSGQGPYFGQATWFARFHAEKVQSATDRYVKEIERVIGVLDTVLQKTEWLVGDKCTYADLSFVTWAEVGEGLLKQLGKTAILESSPHYTRWLEAMSSRKSVADVTARMAAGRAAHNLP